MISQDIITIIRILAGVFALVHLLSALVLFQQISSVNKLVHAPHSGAVTFLGIVHLLVLTAILLAVIFY